MELEGDLPLPPSEGEDTIFEYVVNDAGAWEHWVKRVSVIVMRCCRVSIMNTWINMEDENIEFCKIDTHNICILHV